MSFRRAGMGDASSFDAAGTLIGTGTSLLGAGASLGVSTGLVSAGGALTSVAAIAGPIGAIAAVLIPLLTKIFSGCGQTCVLTSQAANQIETLLKQNLQAYLSSDHTYSEQQAALANFDAVWAKLEQYCGSGQFGTAGTNCIQDRQSGSCKWQTSPGGWSNGVYTAPGSSGSGTTCWNWFVGYRDPIANDPTVKPDPVTNLAASASGGGITNAPTVGGPAPSIFENPLLIVLALIAAAFVIPELV